MYQRRCININMRWQTVNRTEAVGGGASEEEEEGLYLQLGSRDRSGTGLVAGC